VLCRGLLYPPRTKIKKPVFRTLVFDYFSHEDSLTVMCQLSNRILNIAKCAMVASFGR